MLPYRVQQPSEEDGAPDYSSDLSTHEGGLPLGPRWSAQPASNLQMQQGLSSGDGSSKPPRRGCAKPRLRWTPQLHSKFLAACNELGGPEKATPKQILGKMHVAGLGVLHVKSHLQKYRVAITPGSREGSKAASAAPREQPSKKKGGPQGAAGSETVSCSSGGEEERAGDTGPLEFGHEDAGFSWAPFEVQHTAAPRALDKRAGLVGPAIDGGNVSPQGEVHAGVTGHRMAPRQVPAPEQRSLQQLHMASSPESSVHWGLPGQPLPRAGASRQASMLSGATVHSSIGGGQHLLGQLAPVVAPAGGQALPTPQACLHSAGTGDLGQLEGRPVGSTRSAPISPSEQGPPRAPLAALRCERHSAGALCDGAGSDAEAPPGEERGRGRCMEQALALQMDLQRQLQAALEAQRQLQHKLMAHGEFMQSLIKGGGGLGPGIGSMPDAANVPSLKPGEGMPEGCKPVQRGNPAGTAKPGGLRKAAAAAGSKPKRSLSAAHLVLVLAPGTGGQPCLAAAGGGQAPAQAAGAEQGGVPAARQPQQQLLLGRLSQQQGPPALPLPMPSQQDWARAAAAATSAPAGAAAPTLLPVDQGLADFHVDPSLVLARLAHGLPVHRLELEAVLGPGSSLTEAQKQCVLHKMRGLPWETPPQQQQQQPQERSERSAAFATTMAMLGSQVAPMQLEERGLLLDDLHLLDWTGQQQYQQQQQQQQQQQCSQHTGTTITAQPGRCSPSVGTSQSQEPVPGGSPAVQLFGVREVGGATWEGSGGPPLGPEALELLDAPGVLDDLFLSGEEFM